MFCSKCGKQLPDGSANPCGECVQKESANNSYAPQADAGPAPYQPPVYNQPVQPREYEQYPGYSSAPAKKSFFKRFKVPVIIVAAILAVALIGGGAFAIANGSGGGGGGGVEKMFTGISDMFDTGDEYTFMSLGETLMKEVESLSKDGTSTIALSVESPYGDEASATLSFAKDGKQFLVGLEADANGENLDKSQIFISKDMMGFELFGSGDWYGVNISDIDKSLYENDMFEKGYLTDILDQLFSGSAAATKEYQDIAAEATKIVYASIPKDCFEKKSGVTYGSEKCTQYVLTMDGDQMVKFLTDVVTAMSKNQKIKDFLTDIMTGFSSGYSMASGMLMSSYYSYGSGTQIFGQDIENFNVDDFFDDLKFEIEDMYIDGDFIFSVYYSGKTAIGFELEVTGDVKMTADYIVEKSKTETTRTFSAKSGNEKIKIVSEYSGTKNDSTETLKISVTDYYGTSTTKLTLNHKVDGDVATDSVKFDVEGVAVVLTQKLTGDVDKDFTAVITMDMDYDGDAAQFALTLGYSSKAAAIAKPDATIISDGTETVVDEDKLMDMIADLEDSIYAVEDFMYELSYIFGF